MTPSNIDFDDIESWSLQLNFILCPIIPQSTQATLRAAAPEFIEEACDVLFEVADRERIIDAVIEWIGAGTLTAYHGSRLTGAERISIQREGLRPLKATDRRERLVKVLSKHSRWEEVSDRLDSVLDALGPQMMGGRREGQVHTTLSRSGLESSFNHYLTHGSEFDQHVAQQLFGSEGLELLAAHGEPTIVKLSLPGHMALQAAHPDFGIDDMRQIGEVPSIVNEFIEAWSYRLAHPDFESRCLKADCGMIFDSAVPPHYIQQIEILDGS